LSAGHLKIFKDVVILSKSVRAHKWNRRKISFLTTSVDFQLLLKNYRCLGKKSNHKLISAWQAPVFYNLYFTGSGKRPGFGRDLISNRLKQDALPG